MKSFWKVHKNDLKEFFHFIFNNYEIEGIDNIKKDELYKMYLYRYYNNEKYIYICVGDLYGNNRNIISCLTYNKSSYDWYMSDEWTYKGEYAGRYKKLKKLNEISKQ